MPLTIVESTLLLRVAERVVDLLALDEVWTVYLTAAREGNVSEVDFVGLIGLAEQTVNGLNEIAEIGAIVPELLSSEDDKTVSTGLLRLQEQYGNAELFEWLLSDEASLREMFISAWNWVLVNIEEERKILLDKQAILASGELCDPDFRFRFRCILVIAGIGAGAVLAGAGVVSVLGIGLTVGLGAIATAGGAALAWKDAGCGGEVKTALQ